MPHEAETLKHLSCEDLNEFTRTSTTWRELIIKCGYKKYSVQEKKPVVRRLNQLNISYDHLVDTQKTILKDITDEQFTKFVADSASWGELLFKCGYKNSPALLHGYNPSHRTTVQKRINKMNLPYDHLHAKLKPIEQLVGGKRSGNVLKRQLRDSGRLWICEWCRCEKMTLENGEWMWNGEPLQLHVDHIRGRNFEGCDELWNLVFCLYACRNRDVVV